jgi:hypothetical protein
VWVRLYPVRVVYTADLKVTGWFLINVDILAINIFACLLSVYESWISKQEYGQKYLNLDSSIDFPLQNFENFQVTLLLCTATNKLPTSSKLWKLATVAWTAFQQNLSSSIFLPTLHLYFSKWHWCLTSEGTSSTLYCTVKKWTVLYFVITLKKSSSKENSHSLWIFQTLILNWKTYSHICPILFINIQCVFT